MTLMEVAPNSILQGHQIKQPIMTPATVAALEASLEHTGVHLREIYYYFTLNKIFEKCMKSSPGEW